MGFTRGEATAECQAKRNANE